MLLGPDFLVGVGIYQSVDSRLNQSMFWDCSGTVLVGGDFGDSGDFGEEFEG